MSTCSSENFMMVKNSGNRYQGLIQSFDAFPRLFTRTDY